MKKLLTSNFLQVLLSAFLLSVTLFVTTGCQEKTSPILLQLSESTVEVPAMGETVSVGYLCEGLSSGSAVIEATQSPEWIHSFNYDQKDVISFTVDPNRGWEPRSAEISFRLSGASEPAILKVLQQADDVDFKVELKDVAGRSVLAEISPKSSAQTYIAALIDKEDADKGSDDDALYEILLDELKLQAIEAEMKFTPYFQSLMTSGNSSFSQENLQYETEYALIVVGVSENKERQTAVIREDFKTLAMEASQMTFKIQCDIHGTITTVNITPSVNDELYYHGVVSQEQLDVEGITIQDLVQNALDTDIENGAAYGLSPEEVMAEVCTTGQISRTYEYLTAQKDYIAYAIAVDPTGVTNSEPSQYQFNTGDVLPSDNELTLTLTKVNADQVDYSIKTTNEDPYIIVIEESARWESMSDEEIMSDVISDPDIYFEIRYGDYSGTLGALNSETDHYAMVFGYMNGMPTTDLVKVPFTTPAKGSAVDMTFEVTFENINRHGADVTIKGTPETALYLWDIVDGSYSEEQVWDYIETQIKEYIEFGYVADRAEFMQIFGARGENFYQYANLLPGTSYKIFAYGVHEDTGEAATGMFISDSFTTTAAELADNSITVKMDKYFNGTDIAALYPDFQGTEGSAIIPITIETTGDVSYVFYNVYMGDYTDTEADPDSVIIEDLLYYGESAPENIFVTAFGDITLMGVAMDSNENYGPVFRQLVNLTKEGVSPASEFVYPEYTLSKMARNAFREVKPGRIYNADQALDIQVPFRLK